LYSAFELGCLVGIRHCLGAWIGVWIVLGNGIIDGISREMHTCGTMYSRYSASAKLLLPFKSPPFTRVSWSQLESTMRLGIISQLNI
jgi:hypothetical protein